MATTKIFKFLQKLSEKICHDFVEIHPNQFVFAKYNEKKLFPVKKNIKKLCNYICIFNKINPFKVDLKFRHFLKEEKANFIHEDINPSDLISFFCVKPKLNNPRILNQKGAFFIFGFAYEDAVKATPPSMHLSWQNPFLFKKSLILIKKSYKFKIVDELEQLNINRAFLFPEIENVAQVVMKNFKKRCKKEV